MKFRRPLILITVVAIGVLSVGAMAAWANVQLLRSAAQRDPVGELIPVLPRDAAPVRSKPNRAARASGAPSSVGSDTQGQAAPVGRAATQAQRNPAASTSTGGSPAAPPAQRMPAPASSSRPSGAPHSDREHEDTHGSDDEREHEDD